MKMDKPKIPKLMEELDVSRLIEIEEERFISRGIVSEWRVLELPDSKISFDQVLFQDISFEGVRFDQVEFIDCKFERCDLSNVDFGNSVFHRVEFHQSKLVGAQCTQSRFSHVLMNGCVANYAAFSFSRIKQVKIEKTALNKADFFECTFEKVEFNECELDGVNFTETSLEKIDLSTCTYEDITVSLEKLAGCTVSEEQAMGFAKSLGLLIKE
jgi:uncharacterized protein YjbI with pentapeptide repeats